MKSKITIPQLFTIIIGLMMVPDTLCRAQSHGVDWVHGLGGDNSSLQQVATFYESSRPILTPSRLSYPTGDGITSMANMVRWNTGGAGRIGIGHSMGGTAIRQTTLWNNSQWSGVVTLGSPLRGATYCSLWR